MNKEKMGLSEKIDFLNSICNNSLSLMASSSGWSLHSYGVETPFCGSPWLQAESIEKVIDKALEYLFDQGDY